MVGTRAKSTQNIIMQRERLEAMTLEETKQEALRYQLPAAASSDRDLIIEAIMSHIERNNPPEEMLQSMQRSRTQGVRSRRESSQAVFPGPSQQATAPASEIPGQQGSLDRIAAALGVFMEQQQQMLEEIRALSRREAFVLSDAPQEREIEESPRSPAISTSSPAQAVSLLSPQIPEFGGTDEENIQIWAQRVDRVAQVH